MQAAPFNTPQVQFAKSIHRQIRSFTINFDFLYNAALAGPVPVISRSGIKPTRQWLGV